jgi:hypothetical protein
LTTGPTSSTQKTTIRRSSWQRLRRRWTTKGRWTEETARLGRLHNDANVVSLGARQYPIEDAVRFAEIFLTTDFTQETRHKRRIAILTGYERSGVLPEA